MLLKNNFCEIDFSNQQCDHIEILPLVADITFQPDKCPNRTSVQIGQMSKSDKCPNQSIV